MFLATTSAVVRESTTATPDPSTLVLGHLVGLGASPAAVCRRCCSSCSMHCWCSSAIEVRSCLSLSSLTPGTAWLSFGRPASKLQTRRHRGSRSASNGRLSPKPVASSASARSFQPATNLGNGFNPKAPTRRISPSYDEEPDHVQHRATAIAKTAAAAVAHKRACRRLCAREVRIWSGHAELVLAVNGRVTTVLHCSSRWLGSHAG